jgi:alkyldihydroxyacetonephosphate synthase
LAVGSEHEVIARLEERLGAGAVERDEEERRAFAEDSLGRRGDLPEASLPLAIVRPASAEEVAFVLELASEAGVPVVPFGAGTGLMGGARSLQPSLVLDTERLCTIEVVAEDRFVWAGAGAVLADVDRALAEHGLCLGHDPWTFPVATVGGALSTNGLGYKGGRYGGMGDQALAIEVALADGSLIRTKALSRHSSGPNLTRLFIGAEGTLGVITAAALRGHPKPERQELRAYNFASFAAGFRAITAMAALGLRPSLLDYGEEHASPWPELIGREEDPPLLYLGFEGFAEEVDASIGRAERIVHEAGGRELPRQQVQDFWDNRHVSPERFGRPRRSRWRNQDVAFDYLHVALPPSQVLVFQEHCHAATKAAGVALLECGMWVGPELFSAQLALPEKLGGHARVTAVMDDLLRFVQAHGGAMEYVHGAGARLSHLMEAEHGPAMTTLRRLKAALDPQGILNPGKLGL